MATTRFNAVTAQEEERGRVRDGRVHCMFALISSEHFGVPSLFGSWPHE